MTKANPVSADAFAALPRPFAVSLLGPFVDRPSPFLYTCDLSVFTSLREARVEQACLVETPAGGDVDRLRRLYERNPTSTIFARLADAHLATGDTDRAIEVCRQGLRYRPSYITGHLVLARALTMGVDLQGAEEEFQKVLRLDPDNPAAVRYLASLAERAGHTDRAETLWARLRTLDPLNPALLTAEPPAAPSVADGPDPEPVDEETGPTAGNGSEEFPFVSMTLARLYVSQGHRSRAERVVQLIDPNQADELLDQLARDVAHQEN